MDSLFKKIALFFATIGPGIFLIGYNIGTGSIVTMAKAGANHSMTLLWAVTLSCIFTYVLMVAYGQVTIITGQTALKNFRQYFKKWRIGDILSVYIIIALILGELLALLGIVGIVTDLLHEGTKYVVDEGISRTVITIVLAAAFLYLFWTGTYKLFERIFMVFVLFMTGCFVLAFFMVKPDFAVIARGLVPSIPDHDGSLGLIAAMAGTTVSAAVFIIRSTVVAEKGWKVEDLKVEKRDAAVSASMMLFLSGIIMAVAAGTLFVKGFKLEDTIELIHLFEPIGGKPATILLILGISAAGISTVFPIILIAPWLIADFAGLPRNIQSPMFRALGVGGILLALLTLAIDQRPPALMVFSQSFQAFILPAVVVPIMALINRKDVMGQYTANMQMNIGLFITLLFGIMTASFAVTEFVF